MLVVYRNFFWALLGGILIAVTVAVLAGPTDPLQSARVDPAFDLRQERPTRQREYGGKLAAARELARLHPEARELVTEVTSRQEAAARGLLNRKAFALGGARRRYLFYPGDINYVDPQTGEIAEADPTFIAQPDGTFAMTKASYHAVAPAFADEPLQFTVDGETVTFAPQGMGTTTLETVVHVAGVLEDTRVRYADAFGAGIDYVIAAEPDELRKLVVFRQAPPFAEDFRVEFSTSLQVEAVIRGKNTQLGQTHFRQPGVWDNAGVSQPITVNLTAGRLAKVLPITFFTRPDESLDAPSLQYPVTTDVTTSYYAGAGDGYVEESNNIVWATGHDAVTGDVADYTGTTGQDGPAAPDSGGFDIKRAFFPIDTSGIADNDEITDARLNVYVTAKTNTDNDGDDWVNAVQTTQAATTSLVTGDYDQCGSISNPTEGATRIDIGSITTSAYNTWTLDATGEGWISKTGTTQLGLREGHDAINSAVGSTGNTITFSTSENTGTSQDPYLEVDTTAAAITKVVRTNDDGKEIFATSTEGLLVTTTFVGETNGNTTIEYVVFMDLDADNTPDTNETYVTNNCAGSAAWSADNYTKQTTSFTIADGASPKTDSWECSTASFPEENGLYKIYVKWYDANGTIVATGTPTFQYCDQPTGTDSWWDTSMANRALIQMRAATFSEALIDFPILVKATSSNQILDDIDSSGDDVRFLDEDTGTMLNFEKDFVDATTTLEAYWWVQVPKVATSTDCDYIMMYYDNTGTSTVATTTGVWRQDYYEAVWHFSEVTSSTPGTLYLLRDGEGGYTGTDDTYLYEDTVVTVETNGWNYGSSTSILADESASTGTDDQHALTKFDVSSVPATCTVSNVYFTIYYSNATANAYDIYEMLRSWVEGYKNGSTPDANGGATWDAYDGTNAWQTAGADGANDRNSTSFGDLNGGTLNSFATTTFNATGKSVVQGWVNGTNSNEGIWIGPGDGTETDGVAWDSNNGSTTARRPKLTIECDAVAADVYLDSTLNNHDETNSTVASRKERATGIPKFGYSPKLAGSAGTGIGIPDSTGFDITSYTITGWFRRDGTGDPATFSASQTHEPFIAKGYAEADTQAADIQFSVGFNRSGQATLAANWEDDRHAAGNDWSELGGTTISNSTWYEFGYRLKNEAIANIYLNGYANNTTTYPINQGASTGGTMKLGIGTAYNTSATADGGWNGYLDELRIYKVAIATTTASNESPWLRAEWFTADNGMVEWGTEATTSGTLSVTASTTVLAFTDINYSFSAQTSTAADAARGSVKVVGGGGTWTLNLNCNANGEQCYWNGPTERDRFRSRGGVTPSDVASTTGILCITDPFTCNKDGGGSCTGVTLTAVGCIGTASTKTMATGSSAASTYWLKEADWAIGVPGGTSAGVYTTTITWDLQ